jgi:hypothetical protein
MSKGSGMAAGAAIGKTLRGGAEGDSRSWVRIGEIDFAEPMTEAECRAMWEDMRAEEKEQSERLGETWESALAIYRQCRRTGAIYHKGELLGVGLIMDAPNGDSVINFTRTNAAMKRGVHKLTWAKAIGAVVRHVKAQDVAAGHAGRLLFVTPTDYARAIEFYCRHAHGRVVGEVSIEGRPHALLEVAGEEEQ